jgi:hypothetical protein
MTPLGVYAVRSSFTTLYEAEAVPVPIWSYAKVDANVAPVGGGYRNFFTGDTAYPLVANCSFASCTDACPAGTNQENAAAGVIVLLVNADKSPKTWEKAKPLDATTTSSRLRHGIIMMVINSLLTEDKKATLAVGAMLESFF